MTFSKRAVLLAIFVLSGAAALIDEIVWSRQLVLVFGNTTQAVSAILAGFFGGIAVGSFVGGRIADRVRVPVRMYAVLELVLAVVVLVTPLSFRLINTLYRDIYPSLEASPGLLALARVALAVLALAPATILMGATLPTLTRQFAGDVSLAGAFSRLYAANTIGAIVGTVVAGFVLIELLGLSGALAVGASCSAVAGLAAMWLGRDVQGAGASCAPTVTREAIESSAPPIDRPATSTEAAQVAAATAPRPSTVARADARRRSIPALALGVAFVSGLTSLGYQVTWTRLLASGTGNTTYVFTTILAMFLLGLAIGAVLFAALRTRLGDPIRLLAVSQIIAAVLATLGLVFVLVAAEPPTPNKWQESLETLFRASFIVVLPVTIALGVAFPASSALLPDEAAHAGQGSGSLLAVNTIGSIAGSLLVPFFLIPLVGSPVLVAGLAAVNASVGLLLGWKMSRRSGSDEAPAAARAGRTERPLDRRRRCPGPDRDRRHGHPPRSPRPTRGGVCRIGRREALRIVGGRDRVGPGRTDPAHSRAVGRRDLDDAPHDRRQADAGPPSHRPSGVHPGARRRVRDGFRVPRRCHRGARRPTLSSSSRASRRCSAGTTRTPRRSSRSRTAASSSRMAATISS